MGHFFYLWVSFRRLWWQWAWGRMRGAHPHLPRTQSPEHMHCRECRWWTLPLSSTTHSEIYNYHYHWGYIYGTIANKQLEMCQWIQIQQENKFGMKLSKLKNRNNTLQLWKIRKYSMINASFHKLAQIETTGSICIFFIPLGPKNSDPILKS